MDARHADYITFLHEQCGKLEEALTYCALPFEQKHLVKRELIGEAAKHMMTAKFALAEYKKALEDYHA